MSAGDRLALLGLALMSWIFVGFVARFFWSLIMLGWEAGDKIFN